jgi:hypothetical protein
MRGMIMKIGFVALFLTFACLVDGISGKVSFLPVAKGQTQSQWFEKKIYRHSMPRFSIEYLSGLTIQEFSDSVCLISNQSRPNRIDICINWIPIQSKRYEYQEALKVYKTLKKAEINKPIELRETTEEVAFAGTYTKIKDEVVAGNQAFRILSVSEPKRATMPTYNRSKPLPARYDVRVYFKRGKYLWEITSMAFSKEEQETAKPFLETVLEGLRFRTLRR